MPQNVNRRKHTNRAAGALPPSAGLRLWKGYLAPYGGRLLLALLAMGAYAGAYSAIPVGVEWINSAFSEERNRFAAAPRDVLIFGPLLIAAVGAATAFALYWQQRLSVGVALLALRDMQRDMFANLLTLDLAQIRGEASGQMISRFSNDPMVLRESLTRIARAVRDVMTLAALFLLMIYYDWLLFVIVVGVYALIGWPVVRIGSYLRVKSRETQAQAGEIASLVNETLAGARVVKTYQLEPYERARGEAAFDERLALVRALAFTRALNEPVIFVIGSVAIGAVVAAGAWRVMAGALEGYQFVAFMVTLVLLSQPARSLSSLNAVLQEGLGAFERMLSVIDMAPEIVDAPDAEDIVISAGAVEFNDVSFSYGEGAAALEGFTLNIPAGATVALVGPSGAGKSTVFHLIARLYDADTGAIRIDGADIAGVRLASLRRAIAVVSQEAFLFDDTVRANIAAGAPGSDEQAVVDAAKAAAADAFIEALPERYETRVGEGGERLSGGERQRVALARAFLKDAPILLLDEATSALDAASEAVVQAALARLARGRTTLVIAHRLATVQSADMIVVIDRGRIVARGTHGELMEASPLYARLAALQFMRAGEAAE